MQIFGSSSKVDANEWLVDSEQSINIRFNRDYQLLLSINGLTATLLLDNKDFISHSFEARLDETGFAYLPNDGMVGVGTDNSKAYFDNVMVQVLPPEITFTDTDDFSDGQANLFTGEQSGDWQVNDQRYENSLPSGLATSLMDIGLPAGLETSSVMVAEMTFNSDALAGFVFDAYSDTDFKFAGLDAASGQVVIGHSTRAGSLVYDATIAAGITTGTDYELGIYLKGTTVSLTLNGGQVLGHIFNGLVVDGRFGVLSNGASSFDEVMVQTDDPAFRVTDPDNQAPVALDDSAGVDEDTAISLDVLANDSDPDSADTLTITAVTQGSAGGLISTDGSLISYDPTGVLNSLAAGESVTDTFGYTISDGNGGFANASVSITVTGLNDTPVVLEDAAVTTEDATVTIDALANDSDPDNSDSLTISSVTQGSYGGLVSFTAGSLVYDPNGQFDALLLGESTTDTFSYTVSDNNGTTATTTVTVTINGISAGNRAPLAEDNTLQTDEDTPLPITAAELLANDSDPDGDALVIISITQPANGMLTPNGDGSWSYAPNANFNGTDSFSYTVSDGQGGTATADVIITVSPVNDAPTADTDNYEATEGTPLTITIASLLANDADIDGDVLSVTDLLQPADGSLVNNGNGTLTYTSDIEFIGEDTFSYRANDGSLASDPVTVTITVSPLITGTETYTMDQALTIPDNGFIISTINVGDSFNILDINIELNLTHSRNSDLEVVLISPHGIPIELFNSIGGKGKNFIDTTLDDAGTTLISDGSAPFTGVFRPVGDLGSLEGLDVKGNWTLEIYDLKRRKTGTLESWSIVVERGSALMAAQPANEDTQQSPELDNATLEYFADIGLQLWAESGLVDDEALAGIKDVRFEVADLAGLLLGLADNGIIQVDVDAAGHGWFVDPTPLEGSEFELSANGGLLVATADSAADGKIDLLTVLMHEMGHMLDLGHGDGDELMAETLATGERHLPGGIELTDSSETISELEELYFNAYGNPIEHYGAVDTGLAHMNQKGAIKQFLA